MSRTIIRFCGTLDCALSSIAQLPPALARRIELLGRVIHEDSAIVRVRTGNTRRAELLRRFDTDLPQIVAGSNEERRSSNCREAKVSPKTRLKSTLLSWFSP